MGEGNYSVFHHKDGDLDIWTYGESDRPPTHTCILLGGHGCTIGSMVNEFFADIMPRLLQYKSDRGTLQYRIKFILACPRDARLMTYTGEMEIGWFDYLTGDNQPTDPAMKARFKDNLKKEPLVKSVIALVKAEAIKLGDNLETGLKKCMLCGYSMDGVMITYIVSEHELRVLGVLAIHCQILDCTDAKRLANNVDHLVLINRSGDGVFSYEEEVKPGWQELCNLGRRHVRTLLKQDPALPAVAAGVD